MKKFLTFVLAALASVATFAGTLSCAEAVEIAKGLEPNTPSEDDYIVEGYVVSVIKSSATDLSFWMADDVAAEKGTFEAWMCTGDIVNKGDKVTVTGFIQWYVNQDNPEDQKAEIAGGNVVVVEPATALPTLFDDGVKGNKFMHNGQLIIRKAGKHFNAVGAEF